MAFMPEDVLKKSFTTTQFRRGYHEHEVDEFLDVIVAEMRRMNSEKEDLGEQLKACQASEAVIPAEVQDRISAAIASAEKAEGNAATRIAQADADAQQAETQAAERIKAAKEAADKSTRSSFAVSPTAVARDDQHGTAGFGGGATAGLDWAAGVSPVAENLNGEYASNGQSRDYQLLGESAARRIAPPSADQAKYDEPLPSDRAMYEMHTDEHTVLQEQMFAEAREQSAAMVGEVRQKSAEVLLALSCERRLLQQKSTEMLQGISHERDLLQKKIEELRTLESDRRARLKSHLQDQLLELEQTGAGERDDRRQAKAPHAG
jgi:DivIVA domain-containing protein